MNVRMLPRVQHKFATSLMNFVVADTNFEQVCTRYCTALNVPARTFRNWNTIKSKRRCKTYLLLISHKLQQRQSNRKRKRQVETLGHDFANICCHQFLSNPTAPCCLTKWQQQQHASQDEEEERFEEEEGHEEGEEMRFVSSRLHGNEHAAS